ncbi:DUF4012 domain-containing protein [Candidatus Daviesbacteria bacterium]|nr:DUF4012 domain-containing protein [Candidatus Daviesbacteria bacterium]
MSEIVVNSNKNPNILLARNTPVALVVGAASFFGSHLVDKLLSKNIQVIGVDDLRMGERKNLSKAIENKDFHFYIDSFDQDLNLKFNRLDYIFIVSHLKLDIKEVMNIFKKFKPRLLLISSIDLYDKKGAGKDIEYLTEVESAIAKVAKGDNLNARILRLGAIYGPRMNFNLLGPDPLIRLIQQSLTGDLQKEISLDFSSRALFVDDACDLAVKCIFAGATAQKIFDGVNITPIKVAEIKQILLDPVWYENKDFKPSELPPWPTPNLEKTIKFLNWQPKNKLVSNLKETLSYFKENEIKVPELEVRSEKLEAEKESEQWKMKKAEELRGLRLEGSGERAKTVSVSTISLWIGILIISYGLIWPIFQISFGVLTYKYQLSEAIKDLEKGEFEKSLSKVNQAGAAQTQAKSVLYSLEPLQKIGFKTQFEIGDKLLSLATLSLDSAQNTILGMQALITSLRSITGELNESPQGYFDKAQTFLRSADEDLSKAEALTKSEDFKANLPKILKSDIENLSERLTLYANLVKKARSLSGILPEIVALKGEKNYLVLLQNNSELRPAGGFIESFAKVSFEGGKLKKLQVNDVGVIDGQLNLHVEPPPEIKKDLNQANYYLRDSNWEPDFPTSARQAEWFFTKETGERVEGVIALDISAIEDLLSVVGSLNLADYKEKIDSLNLFEKAVGTAEAGFLTSLTTGLFNKLFFLPNQNWPEIMTSLSRSLERKHMSIYLDDPILFSYIVSENWAGLMPRPSLGDEEFKADFLALVEANLGVNKANYYLDRSYNLETNVDKEGEILHKLKITYTNRSPSDVFPAGKYKNRMRIYLPTGSKLTKVLWGEDDMTKKVTSFMDYGRTGYSFLIELLPKEQKELVIDYSTPVRVEFKQGKAQYKLEVIKQAGTLKDPFEWRVIYPIDMKLASGQAREIGPQQYSVKTDLSEDRIFQLQFIRP